LPASRALFLQAAEQEEDEEDQRDQREDPSRHGDLQQHQDDRDDDEQPDQRSNRGSSSSGGLWPAIGLISLTNGEREGNVRSDVAWSFQKGADKRAWPTV
jgi:hypothetical protein